MINCKNCGVELDEHMNFCPLCGVPIYIEDHEKRQELIMKKRVESRKLRNEIDKLDKTQRRKLFWEIASIILGGGMISTSVLNLIINGSFTWSVYVLIGGANLFTYVTIFSFVKRDLWTYSSLILPATFLFMVILDIAYKGVSWSVQLGLPLLLAGWIVMLALVEAVKYSREKGFNIIAYIFLSAALLTIAIEGIISLYGKDKLQLEWSIIIAFSIIPVALILLYIHYKLRRGTDLRKFFHI